jgi:predicted small secreted protein
MNKLFLLVLMLFALSACNTFEGMGKDIQDLGKTIEDKSKE